MLVIGSRINYLIQGILKKKFKGPCCGHRWTVFAFFFSSSNAFFLASSSFFVSLVSFTFSPLTTICTSSLTMKVNQ